MAIPFTDVDEPSVSTQNIIPATTLVTTRTAAAMRIIHRALFA